MLTEDEVIQAVCRFLMSNGFVVDRTCTAMQRGNDIEGKTPDGRLIFVEAKGETSSKESTNRFGKPFNKGQVNDHVAKALLRACRGVGTLHLWAMAFPSNEPHRHEVQRILPALAKLKIEVFWVHSDRTVTPQGIWQDYFREGLQIDHDVKLQKSN